MYALNFYSPLVADQLRTHRKTATIRLGDKSGKYKKGMIVTVLVGVRYGQREKIFDAVIDKVEVKQINELSPREIEHDNPEIRRPDEMTRFLGQLYNREVSEDETVTVIRFSQIIGSMFYVGEPMVPPRTPSFAAACLSLRSCAPAGQSPAPRENVDPHDGPRSVNQMSGVRPRVVTLTPSNVPARQLRSGGTRRRAGFEARS